MQRVLVSPVRPKVGLDRLARMGLLAVPLLFAVPIFLGLAHSVIDLLGEPNPYFADISGTTADARALALRLLTELGAGAGTAALAMPA